MKASKLGIYVDTEHLLKEIYLALFEFNKKDRIILGDKILDKTANLLSHIAMANNYKDKRLQYIDMFIGDFEILKGYLRLAIDLGMLKDNFKIPVFTYIARIDTGIGKWRSYTQGRQSEHSSN